MLDKIVNILGTEWGIKEQSENENELLKDCDGYCDWTSKEIIVEREDYGNLKDMQKYINKVLRHEIIHAFLFESGLAECSNYADAWSKNEEMVDFFAIQLPKITETCQSINCL